MATMPSKEKFKEIIVTLLQTKNHNCISLSDTQYAEIVKTLKRVKTTGPKSCKDYYRKNRFSLTLINGEERLTKSGTNLEFVSTDDLFDVIHQAHMFTNHGRRNTMVKLLATKYANITQEQVMVYLKMCEECRINHKSKIWKGFNLNFGESPVPRPDMTMISDSDQLPGQMVKSQHFTPEMTMISDSDQLPGQMVKSQHFTSEMTVISDSDQLSGQMVKSQRYTPEMTVISDSDQLPGQMVKTQCFSPEMAMISDSDQLPEQMVKTQHFAPELPVKCEPDQLEVQIVKTQHFTEAMEVQSAVAAATANIIPQSPIESYDPGPEQSLQNSKMRGCTDKDMALSFSASSRPVVVFKKTYVDPEHTDGMMKSLASLWRKRRLCDAKICSGDKNVTLHRLVLFAASPHLMEKNITDGADLEVNLPAGISEDGLKIFVSFLYDGVLNLNEHLYKDVERISNLLKVDKVQKHCREFSASLNEHRQMTSSPLMSIPRRRDNLPKSQKSSNRQTVVLTLSDDSNPAESSLGHPSTHQQPQEHTLTLSQSQYEDLQNNIDERIQALNEHHAFMTSHHDRYPPVTQNSGISLQTATNPTMASESGIKTEPIEILDDDITDYPPTTPPTQDNIKHSKRILNSSKSFASESPGSETMRRSSQNLPSSTVTRTYLPTSKCESGLDMNEMDGIATSGASSTTSPYPVSLVASSGETFPLYTLSSNQS